MDRSHGNWHPGKTLLNEYEVRKVLGQGGMGKVYLVERLSDGMLFAVKTMLENKLSDLRRRLMFIRELRTWMDLPEHPNLVVCRFFRTIENRLALFSDYVGGGSLKHWIAGKKITGIRMILDIAIQSARGLHAAHREGLIHQDVKPANILMTPGGEAKITDFGLTRARLAGGVELPKTASRDTTLTSVGGLSLAYCSPEQGLRQKLDLRTDIWSLGLTILEMFAGSARWNVGIIARDFLEKYRENTPPGKPVIPDSLALILERCFQNEPSDRWQDMVQLAGALESVYREITGNPYPREKPEVTPRPAHAPEGGTRRTGEHPQWEDPAKWLEPVLTAMEPGSAADPEEPPPAKAVSSSDTLADLETYEEALQIYTQLVMEGRKDLEDDLANLLFHKAALHASAGDLPGAIALYETAIELMEKKVFPDHQVQRMEMLARANLERADALRHSGALQESLTGYDRAVSLWEFITSHSNLPADRDSLAEVLSRKAQALCESDDIPATVNLYDRAIAIREELAADASRPEFARNLAETYLLKGDAFTRFRDFPAAITWYDRAIAIWETPAEDAEESADIRGLSKGYLNKAAALSETGDCIGATRFFDLSISLLENRGAEMSENTVKPLLATAYFRKAACREQVRQNAEALELYDRATGIFEQLANREGRSEFLDELASVYQHKAALLRKLEQYPDSIALLERAVQTFEYLVEHGGRMELLDTLAEVYKDKADTLDASGDPEGALELYTFSIRLLNRLIYQEGRLELLGDYAAARTAKAGLLVRTNQHESAREILEDIIPILQYELERTGRADLAPVLALAEKLRKQTGLA